MPETRTPGSSNDNLTFLCFDFGMRRIGVAVGQTVSTTASPLDVLGNDGGLWARIEELLSQWQPHALVVGIPLTEDGQPQPMTDAARRFARRLHGRYGLIVHHADERHSSRIAEARFREQRQRGGARRSASSKEHAVAAQVILERWFDEHLAGSEHAG